MIRLYLNIPEKFVNLFFLDGFCVVLNNLLMVNTQTCISFVHRAHVNCISIFLFASSS